MARKPRIHFKGAFYHVLLKAGDDINAFPTVADRREWEALVVDGIARFGHKIHAYCWLKQQLSLIIEVSEVPLSRIMQNLSFRYTRYFNKKYGGEGVLFHGRYRAVLFDPKEWLTPAVTYIHNAPARAGTAKSAAAFKWSSHQALTGKTDVPWLTTSTIHEAYGKRPKTAMKALEKDVAKAAQKPFDKVIETGIDGSRILGNAKFRRLVTKPPRKTKHTVTLPKLVKYICQQEGVAESALKTESRARHESRLRQIITCVAMELDTASLTEMSDRFNRDLTTMSRNQRFFREQLASDEELQKKIKRYKTGVLRL